MFRQRQLIGHEPSNKFDRPEWPHHDLEAGLFGADLDGLKRRRPRREHNQGFE